MELKEKLLKQKRVFAGRAVGFSVDEIILPDGNKATREYMEHPGAVAVLAFKDAEHIILVQQYRYPVKEVTFEIPAGKLDKGESPLVCVKRELAEETGYSARRVKKMLSCWPTPAFSDEIIHIYSATDLVPSSHSPDEDEFILTKTVTVSQALAMVRSGCIKDSKTIIALLSWVSNKTR